MKLVIICGGVGTKMWPESRIKSPKHFLPLLNGKSLFQINWETLAKNFPREDIFLQTNSLQADIAKKQVTGIIEGNIFIEPEMRDQGPATGFAAAMLYKKGLGDVPFMLVQSDLLRLPEEGFIKMINRFGELAAKDGKLMTGCYLPEFTVKGVDYLIPGEKISDIGGINIWTMQEWLGRDEIDKIEGFLKQGKARLHYNHLCWTPGKWLQAFKTLKPDWYQPLADIIEGADPAQEYSRMPKGPIEEVTRLLLKDGYLVELPFKCLDFGTWESLDRYYKDNQITFPDEKILAIDSPDNFIRKPPDKILALIGIRDMVVIDTGDALLICPKNQSGKVREITVMLKEKNLTGYL
jgi:mannose-1-phosphate guanylyltransferase